MRARAARLQHRSLHGPAQCRVGCERCVGSAVTALRAVSDRPRRAVPAITLITAAAAVAALLVLPLGRDVPAWRQQAIDLGADLSNAGPDEGSAASALAQQLRRLGYGPSPAMAAPHGAEQTDAEQTAGPDSPDDSVAPAPTPDPDDEAAPGPAGSSPDCSSDDARDQGALTPPAGDDADEDTTTAPAPARWRATAQELARLLADTPDPSPAARELAAVLSDAGFDPRRVSGAGVAQLQVAADGRSFATVEGDPFFWLGDTAWSLFVNLDCEQVITYLDDRAEKGFTVIQAVAVAAPSGGMGPNAYGDRPYESVLDEPAVTEGTAIGDEQHYDYWDHVEFTVAAAAARGLYVAMLPAWSAQAAGEALTEDNAAEYGEFLGARFAAYDNLVWLAGGDDNDSAFPEIWAALAAGIAAGAGVEQDGLLMSYHPGGGSSSVAEFDDAPWLDFHTHQSGHRPIGDNEGLWRNLELSAATGKPFLDSEPSYEAHPIDFEASNGYTDDLDVRQAAYVSVFSGAAGHTYGHHNVWMMYGTPNGGEGAAPRDIAWDEALDAPGAQQMTHLATLIADYPGPRIPAQELLEGDAGLGGGAAIVAMSTPDAVLVYTAGGAEIALSGVEGSASWFDPRSGEYSATEAPYLPPTEQDWVLVIETDGPPPDPTGLDDDAPRSAPHTTPEET